MEMHVGEWMVAALYWSIEHRWLLVGVMLVAWIGANLMVAAIGASWSCHVLVIDIISVVFFVCCSVFFVAGVGAVLGWVLHVFG